MLIIYAIFKKVYLQVWQSEQYGFPLQTMVKNTVVGLINIVFVFKKHFSLTSPEPNLLSSDPGMSGPATYSIWPAISATCVAFGDTSCKEDMLACWNAVPHPLRGYHVIRLNSITFPTPPSIALSRHQSLSHLPTYIPKSKELAWESVTP